MHIVFVCTGNICRSPMAERLALAYGGKFTLPGLRLSSAGTRALIGQKIHPSAATVIRNLGGRTTNFSARQLVPGIVADADLVLTMARHHLMDVLDLAPRLLHKTFGLAEASSLASACGARTISDFARIRAQLDSSLWSDIPDPIGRDQDYFDSVGVQIAELLPPILEVCQNS